MRKVNQSTIERVIRGVVGVILLTAGVLVVKGPIGIVLDVIGVVLLFSGAVGFCHIYKFFRINTSKKA